MDERPSTLKAVVHMADKTLVKGYLNDDDGVWSGRMPPGNGRFPEELRLSLLNGGSATIHLSQAKAVFLVNAFAGQPEYNELKFFKNVPEFPGLWVRLRFADQEITEGLVQNSLGLLSNPGFFLKPPDPQSNNRLVYVLKNQLLNFEILALRSAY